MNLLIAGIHTGIGKTVCSAVFAEALGYDYWKPVQAGGLDASDSMFVRDHRSHSKIHIHDEAYAFELAASPHIAARQEDTEISLDRLNLPVSGNSILVETAGGVMTPLSDTLLNLDLIKHLDLPVVLVSDNYLGSINHTLMSILVLRAAEIHIAGIVFCGEEVPSTREYILQHSGLPMLLSIPKFEPLDKQSLVLYAIRIAEDLKKALDEHCR